MIKRENDKDFGELLEQGLQHSQSGDYEKAIDIFTTIIKQDPENKRAYHYLGSIFMFLKNYQEGLKNFIVAVELDRENTQTPSNSEIYNLIGVCFDRLGDHQTAIEYFKKTASLNPKHQHIWSNLAVNFLALGEIQKAIIYFENAISNNYENIELWENLVMVYEEKQEYSKAMEVLQEALRHNPKNAELIFLKGGIYNKLGEYVEEIICYIDAIKLSAHEPRYWNKMGNTYYDLERFDQAERAYEIGDQIEYGGFKFHSDEEIERTLDYIRYGGLSPI